MEQERLLWEMQTVAQEIYNVRRSEGLRPLITQLKQLQESIQNGEGEAQTLLEQSVTLETGAQELEKQANQLHEQVRGGKEKLYSVKGGSLKELLSMQQSLLKMESEAEKKEAQYFEALKRAEELKKKGARVKEAVKGLKKQYNNILKQYKIEKNKLELRLVDLQFRQEQIKEKMAPETLKIYQEAEKRYPYNPVAMLRGGSCTGCHISIPSSLGMRIREGTTICYCDNCGRIIISPTDR